MAYKIKLYSINYTLQFFWIIKKKVLIDMIEFSEQIKKILLFENSIKEITDTALSANRYYTDLLVVAVVDRALKLSRGFRCLLDSMNIQCALVLARCQIDNLGRFHGINLVLDKRKYVYDFLDPDKRFNKIQGIDGKLLTDHHLVEKLDEFYKSYGIKHMYKEFCKYTHLSDAHHKSCSKLILVNNENYEITSTISKYDDANVINSQSYLNCFNGFLAVCRVFEIELNNYFSNRKDFSNNTVEE